MKPSELTDQQLIDCILKYTRYVVALTKEQEKRSQRELLSKKCASNSASESSVAMTFGGLTFTDEELKKPNETPITKEDLESVTRILKISGFLEKEKRSSTGPKGKVEYGFVKEKLDKATIALSQRNILKKALETDGVDADEKTLTGYILIIDKLKTNAHKLNPLFPFNEEGLEVPDGVIKALEECNRTHL